MADLLGEGPLLGQPVPLSLSPLFASARQKFQHPIAGLVWVQGDQEDLSASVKASCGRVLDLFHLQRKIVLFS